MFLLERLESLIATGTGVPTTRKVLVDKDAILELIDQLRVAVPEEVHAAKRINTEGERIIEKANDEAGRITARAQEQAAYLIGERGLTERAEAEGRQIVAEAMAVADNVRLGRRLLRRRGARDARERGSQGARRDREGHRRPPDPPGRAARRRRRGSPAAMATPDAGTRGSRRLAERRRTTSRPSCARRTRARPSRDDRPRTPGLPARGPARRAARERAPLRDPRRDDPAARRSRVSSSRSRASCGSRARTAASWSTRSSRRPSPGRARAASGTSRSR